MLRIFDDFHPPGVRHLQMRTFAIISEKLPLHPKWKNSDRTLHGTIDPACSSFPFRSPMPYNREHFSLPFLGLWSINGQKRYEQPRDEPEGSPDVATENYIDHFSHGRDGRL